MSRFGILLFCSTALLALSAAAPAQTTNTLAAQTANTTAACAAAGSPSYCQGGFSGLNDSTSGTYDPAPGNVSDLDVHSLLAQGGNMQVYAYFEPWFCMQPGSTATGVGTLCQSHLQVGYNSNDPNTVNGQVQDMMRRGFDGVALDWYGPTLNFYDSVMQKVASNLAARCQGTSCPFMTALLYDQGAFQWADGRGFNGCPQNGGGVDQTNCILSKLESDMDYANTNYFSNPAYLRIDNTPGSSAYMQPTPTGKPAVLFFICEECWTNPSPNWTYIWNQLRSHTNAYSSNQPALLFIYRNAPAFSHVQTNGGFAWVNWYGTDPYGLNYLSNFYGVATSAVSSNPALVTVGASWKGFDESNAPWVTGTPRIMGQQCGNTWLQTFAEANQFYPAGSTPALSFFGVVTWNDYEEGTEVETGIDNCLSLSASVGNNVLKWSLNFSSSSGSESTVNHYEIYSSTNPNNLALLTTVPAGTHAINLSQFTILVSGTTYTMYVKAVGQPSILNKMSGGVKYRKK